MTKQGETVIEFRVPLPPRVLRRNTATVARENPKPGQSARRAVHWSDRSKAKRQYQEEVWIRGAHALPTYFSDREPWERAHVHYVWQSTHETDVDNIIASMKPALDVCKATGPRPLGIIADDGPGVVTVTAEWRKSKKAEEAVVVRIEKR